MSYTVTLRPSGIDFEVEPDETVLAAAIRQGIGLPYGCRDGACGSCKSRLLGGQVLLGEHQHKALSIEEEACGYTLTCKAKALGDLEIEARTVVGAGDYPPRKMPCRVTSISKAAADVAIVKLQLPANEAFRYRAGQYIEFILEGSMRRSYSMANAPHTQSAAPGAELHIRHMPGGRFTDHVFTRMAARDILRIEGPFGSFFLREDSAKPIVLLASGTGFAPIKAIIDQLRFIGSERSAVLYWGCRRRADLYLHDWALQAAAELPWLRYVPVLSEATPEDGWTGRTGFVHTAVMSDLPDLSAHQVYACGTPAMVAAAERDFVSRCKLPAEEFYADAFTSELDKHEA
ncbi:MAG TPA: CDP-6-deoxy-delta-3,4-glucoseen reductase [Burkholderiaceae bacterium]|nr:CDP-6-deoxy-delta-3,4-glucoseen reductase [Burkholderiaceae bacterium]